MKFRHNEAGYTLIEILAVLALLAVLMLMVAPNIIDNLNKGKVSATINQIAATENILTNYFMDNGCFPTTEQGLKALIEKPTLPPVPETWAGPYTNKKNLPTDGWNKELHYIYPGVHNPDKYDLFSYGADNAEGGTKYNADIGNWEK